MGLGITLYLPIDAGQEIKPDVPYWENEYHEFHSGNVTHNLTTMADKADLYEALWRPYKLFNVTDDEEYDIEIHAEDIAPKLKAGIDNLLSEPEVYRTYNPDNGWGSYEGLLNFTQKYHEACIKYPKALVDVSR